MTKTYWDVPEGDRHALTEDEIAHFCTVELAEAGYVRPKVPKVLPEEKPSVPTTTYFRPQLDRYSRLSIAFKTIEEAQAFLKMAVVEIENDYRTDTDYAKELAGMSIEPIEVAAESDIEPLREALAEAKKNKEVNAKARQEYDKDVRTCDDLVESVRADWRQRIEHEEMLERVRETFGEFLTIAEGNRLVATKFLLKKHDRDIAVEALGDSLQFEPTEMAMPAEEAP